MKGPEGSHAWTVTVGADEKRGLAIPEKGSFASLFQQVFRENPQVEP